VGVVTRLLGSVKSKLLLAFAGFLTAITILHTGLTAWLIDRHGEADAFNQLSRGLLQLEDDLQRAREVLTAVAQETARDEKNLSDMAIVYSEAATLKQQPDDIRSRAVTLHKTVSMNRLRLILASARLASVAVYLDGELSYYVTRGDDEGEGLPVLIAPRSRDLHRVTASFEFPADNLMVLRVAVPIQAVPRTSFTETIVEQLAIATGDPPKAETDGAVPRIIGQFIFSQDFTPAFLQESAAKTGVLPAVFSPDGGHHLQLISLGVPDDYLARRDDQAMRVETAVLGDASYYHALRRWRLDGDDTVILGGAFSRAGTIASIEHGIILVVAAAAVILTIGLALGYVWISWMVTPIDALTAAATAIDPANARAQTLHAALGHYLERPVPARTSDEFGKLTNAFNAMAASLHDLIGTLEQQVRERTAQIEAANRELETFSYSVSHDLRAPLRSLDGFSRALLEDYGYALTGTAQDYLHRIRNASQRMGQLIDDLLGLAHVSRVGLLRRPVDLTAIAGSIAHELRQGDPTRQAEIIIAPGMRASGDARLLQIALQNLLQNAWKFTSTRPVARLECGQTMMQGVRTWFVRDNGVGFDMTYAHKLFGAFQRLHTTAEFSGTGIGLATVQRIVHRHGGRVWAESQIERGSTFYFTLADEGTTSL
jgi:signal transduction histidine kinase